MSDSEHTKIQIAIVLFHEITQEKKKKKHKWDTQKEANYV